MFARFTQLTGLIVVGLFSYNLLVFWNVIEPNYPSFWVGSLVIITSGLVTFIAGYFLSHKRQQELELAKKFASLANKAGKQNPAAFDANLGALVELWRREIGFSIELLNSFSPAIINALASMNDGHGIGDSSGKISSLIKRRRVTIQSWQLNETSAEALIAQPK